jgi:uncharacterized membrane protein (DUF4010 family)
MCSVYIHICISFWGNKGIFTTSIFSSAVSGAKTVTAIFDFQMFSDDEISFKKLEKLKICDDITR